MAPAMSRKTTIFRIVITEQRGKKTKMKGGSGIA
jgi:hypothetical protein